MDIRLPDIDGFEVLRHLRSFPETKDILIVAITAQIMPDEVDRVVTAGCNGCIRKPILMTSFRAEVHRHLTTVADGPPR